MQDPQRSTGSGDDSTESPAIRNALEISIRLGAIAFLVGWCLLIIAPFLGIVVWSLIIAIAVDEPFEWLCERLGGRRSLAALLSVSAVLLGLFVPTIIFSETMITGAQDIAQQLRDGTIQVPRPDESIREIPFIGERVHDGWIAASENLGQTLSRFAPQLQAASRWLLQVVGSVGAGVLQLIGSILISGVMLVRAETRRETVEQFGHRMAGVARGSELVSLANGTIRGVVQGIVGVAALQSLLAGAGFLVAGIPGAGLWALLVLIAAVVQLPVFIVMAVPVVIAFTTLSKGAAIALLVWCLLIGGVDNVLKPIFFGRGAKVPSLVIFMGAIGGMLTMGIIGLFLGAAVLALGFELFMAWLDESSGDSSSPAIGANPS